MSVSSVSNWVSISSACKFSSGGGGEALSWEVLLKNKSRGGGEALSDEVSLKNQFPPPPEALSEEFSPKIQSSPPPEALSEKVSLKISLLHLRKVYQRKFPLIKLPEEEETDFLVIKLLLHLRKISNHI